MMKKNWSKRLICFLLSGILLASNVELPIRAAEEDSARQETNVEQANEKETKEETSLQKENSSEYVSAEESISTEEQTQEEEIEMSTVVETVEEETSLVTPEEETSESVETAEEGISSSTEIQSEEMPSTKETDSTEESSAEEMASTEELSAEETVSMEELSSDLGTEEMTTEEIATEEIIKEASGAETIPMYYEFVVNPLYEDILDSEELKRQAESKQRNINSDTDAKSTAVTFQDAEAAAAYVRSQMVVRAETIAFEVPDSLISSNEAFSVFVKNVVNRAITHTEDCSGQEGDALAWGYQSYRVSSSSGSSGVVITYTFTYYTTTANEQELTTKVNSTMKLLDLETKSEYQKIRLIHDYICDNVDYDYTYKKYSAYEAMCTGTAVCQGYAILFYRLCKEAGLSVRVITGVGNGGPHAWNIVKIGDKYYNVDCTWDGQDKETRHTYFLLNEKDFSNHTREDEYATQAFYAQYPMAESSYIDTSKFEAPLDKENPVVSFTTLEEQKVTSAADGKPKLIMFFRTNCPNSQRTIKNIADYKLSNVDVYAVEIDKKSKSEVIQFKNDYGSDNITFCYDTTGSNNNSLWSYVRLGGLGSTVGLPVLCYIDRNNRLQHITQGISNASAIEANLLYYCDAPLAEEYTISYVLYGGTNNKNNPSVYRSTSSTIILQDPTKAGCTFAGWYLDAAFTRKITQIDHGNAGNITLYAKWEYIEASDKLNIGNPECDFITIDEEYVSSSAEGRPKLLVFFSTNCGNSINTIQGISRYGFQDVDIYALDVINSPKDKVVAFKKNYGSDNIVFCYDTLMGNIHGMNLYAELAALDGLSMPIICYIDTNNKFQYITQGYSSADAINTNLHIYCYDAESAREFPITYVLYGGTNNNNNPISYKSISSDIILQEPVREGYIFKGWYRDTAFTQKITKIERGSSGTVVLYAKWEPKNQVTLPVPTIDLTPTAGNVLMGFSGTYYTESSDKILNRLNEIRLEACREGVIDPATNRPLTEADYVPLQWSADLEAIARLRAAEATVQQAHTRPNGQSCFSVRTSNGEQSYAENLAWNNSGLMAGIEQWYGEKKDWVNKNKTKETGHYESLISTRYQYVALGAFRLSSGGWYAVAQEFSDKSFMNTYKDDTSGKCMQYIEVMGSAITSLNFENTTPTDIENGSTFELALNATVAYKDIYGKNKTYKGPIKRGVQWESSDENIASVDEQGVLTAKKAGTVVIRAAIKNMSAQTTIKVYEQGEGKLEIQIPTKTTYLTGEKIDLKGGKVKNSSTGKTVDMKAAMISGFQSDNPGISTVWVTNGGFTASFDVLIVKLPDLTVQYGQTLSQITLPQNPYGTWQWEDASLRADKVGIQTYKINFIPTNSNAFQQLASLDIKVNVCRSIEQNVRVVLKKENCIYNGTYQQPEVVVSFTDVVLEPGKDYQLSYQDNKNVGNAQVIVTGKGDYQGSVTKTFVIQPAKLTIKAKDQTILESDSHPTKYIYEVTGLTEGEKLAKEPEFTCNIEMIRTATGVKMKPGVYDINPNNAQCGANYDKNIIYQKGRLIVAAEKVAYTIDFDMQNHGTAPDKQVIKAGDTIAPFAEPKATGYVFGGWYKEPECKTAWNFDTDIVQSDIVLYAKWMIQDEKGFCVQEIGDVYYTGKACKPIVSVYDGDTLLKVNKDYKISYSANNKEVNLTKKTGNGIGTDFNENIPYVIITGKGNYADNTLYVNFNILPAVIDDGAGNPAAGVTLKYTEQIVANKKNAVKAFSSIKSKRAMRLDMDYNLSLIPVDALDSQGNKLSKDMDSEDLKNARIPAGCTGTFELMITGINNYSGTIKKKIYVEDKSKLMKNAKITLGKSLKNVEFSEMAVSLTPGYYDVKTKSYYLVRNGLVTMEKAAAQDVFTVSFGKEYLIYRKDFEISYENNVGAGKATMTISGIGSYVGSKSVTFQIAGLKLKASSVDVKPQDKVYTGKAVTQNDVMLTYKKSNGEKQAMVYGADYTISYKKNISKGTATMTFTAAKGSAYSGSFNKTFKIAAADINQVKVPESMKAITVNYSKAGIDLSRQVILENAEGIQLQNGKDYTISYANHKAPASTADAEKPTMFIKGKGNYTGTLAPITFTITQGILDQADIVKTITPVVYNENKGPEYEYRPSVKLKEGNQALRMKSDYKVEYVKNTQADYEAYLQKYKAGTVTEADQPAVVITPGENGCYRLANSEQGVRIALPIYKNKLTKSSLHVVVDNAIYTGSQVKPNVYVYYGENTEIVNQAKGLTNESDILALGLVKLESGKDYTFSYGANITAGTNKGIVKISGTSPNYGGDVTIKFTIQKKVLF